MITQVCNLSCQGCTNYSDLRHRGYVSWQQGREWFRTWQHRLDLPDIGIMGGEPLINPEWREWLQGLRDMFPSSQLRFTTNGLLLHRYPDILDFLDSIGNIVFKITVHVQDTGLENQVQDLMTQRNWETVIEHGITRLRNKHGVRLQINRPTQFVSPFRNSYKDMAPWHSNPADAFNRCVQQTCPLMYQGRIYKCSTTALMADTLERFGRPNWSEWQPYFSTGIGLDDSNHRIAEFVRGFGQPESVCGQCPDHRAPVLDHRLTVTLKRA
jgi:organic radical activating enzyme